MDAHSGSTSSWDYVDFDLEINEESTTRSYPVTARSPEGEAHAQMRFPFDEWELRDKLRDLENALLRSGGKRRRIGTPEEQSVQSFGRALFEALLVGDVGAHYRMSLREARRQNKGLRLKLHVRPPELSTLPWEFVYDPQRDYLCLSSMTPLVRYPNVPQPIEQLTVAPPLRILGMVASPRGLSQLDVGHEKRLMEEVIKGLRAQGLVQLSWLEGQSWRDLQRVMRQGPWHVFHFIGHGGFDPETEEGAIALADEEGRTHLLGATALARLLDDHYPLRLVFLNSCEGAKGSPRDAFSSVAATLVRSGAPAVVAMQYEITDRAAIEFSRSFYEAVADGLPVDAAVAEARTAISMASDLEWGTPVLYMRSSDGHIFDISRSQEQADEKQADDEKQAARERYHKAVKEAWTDNHLSDADVERLGALASELNLSTGSAADIEHDVMDATKEATLEHQEQISREKERQDRERQDRLDELRDRARRSHQNEEWQAVIDAFEQIRAEDPDYPDPEGLLASAREALEAQELTQRVAAVYAEGQRHMDAREWQQALECFEEVQQLQTGYRDTEQLLSQVQQELARPPKVEIPDLSGQEVTQARTTLASKGLKLGARSETSSDTAPEGRIIEQNPEPGVTVTPGSMVSVTVSSGPSPVKVPDLAGKSHSQVRNILHVAGLELGTIAEAHSDIVREGRVVQQLPEAGTAAERGTSVRITLSLGPQDLQGAALEDAPPVPEDEFSISNPVRSFAKVVWRVVTKPSGFFSAIPRRGNLLPPVVFAWICIGIYIVLGEVIKLRLSDTGVEYPGGFAALTGAILALILAPIGLFIVAGILHLSVMLIAGSRRSGFEGTLRVCAYTNVANLVSWIPFVGLVTVPYIIYLAVVGIREVHNTSTGRATISVLVPVVVWVLIVLTVVLIALAITISSQ